MNLIFFLLKIQKCSNLYCIFDFFRFQTFKKMKIQQNQWRWKGAVFGQIAATKTFAHGIIQIKYVLIFRIVGLATNVCTFIQNVVSVQIVQN